MEMPAAFNNRFGGFHFIARRNMNLITIGHRRSIGGWYGGGL